MFPRFSAYLRQERLFGSKPVPIPTNQELPQTDDQNFRSFLVKINSKLSERWIKDLLKLVETCACKGLEVQELHDIAYLTSINFLKMINEIPEPEEYNLKLKDIQGLKVSLPNISYHFATKIFKLILENIDEPTRTKALQSLNRTIDLDSIPDTEYDLIDIDWVEEPKEKKSDILSAMQESHQKESAKSITKPANNPKPYQKLSWLENKLCESYDGDVDLSKDMASSIFRALNTNRDSSNSNLQAELFQLLGETNILLIQEIFDKREQICNYYRNQAMQSMQNKQPRQRQQAMSVGVVVTTQKQQKMQKQMRKEDKKIYKNQKRLEKENQVFTTADGTKLNLTGHDDRFLISLGLDPSKFQEDREIALMDPDQSKWYRSFANIASKDEEELRNLPNVYDVYSKGETGIAQVGDERCILPEHERVNESTHEQFVIPEHTAGQQLPGENRVLIDSLDDIGKLVFRGYTALNRIQTLVFDSAYGSIIII